MSIERRIVRLEGYRRDRQAVSGVLFTYTDSEGQRRERVVVATGETLDGRQYAGVDPDRL